jgi:hypothetical protein
MSSPLKLLLRALSRNAVSSGAIGNGTGRLTMESVLQSELGPEEAARWYRIIMDDRHRQSEHVTLTR